MNLQKSLSFFTAIAFIVLLFFIFSKPQEQYNANQRDAELGCIIDSLENGDVYSISDADYAYIFKRLKEQTIRGQKGVMELGSIVYYIREIKGGYVLDNAFEPVNNDYHLVVTQKSIQINPAGQFLNVLFIKKVNGPYYNK